MIEKLPVVVKARAILADYYGWRVHASKLSPRLRKSSKRGLRTMDYLTANHPTRHESSAAASQFGAAGVGIEFPAPPPEVREMNRILSSAAVDLTQLGELAEGYPQLTNRILRLCHSSLFNLPELVSRLEHAVILAGAGNVRTLLLADAVMDYTARRLPEPVARTFWRHSLLVAQLSERLALWTSDPQVEQAYLAGLLHDLGALPMLARTGCENCPTPSPLEWTADAPEAERRRFGTDHCTLGRQIGEAWNFPLPLVEVFAEHHEPCGPSAAFPVTHLVAVAERVCHSCGAAFDSASTSPSSSIRRRIGQIVTDCFPGLEVSDSLQLAQVLESDLSDTGRKLEEQALAGATA